MNKAELITALQQELDAHREQTAGSTTKKEAAQILDAIACTLTKALTRADAGIDQDVTLPGLGKLKTTTRAARLGCNPRTGEPIQIPERVTVKFAAAKALDDLLNA